MKTHSQEVISQYEENNIQITNYTVSSIDPYYCLILLVIIRLKLSLSRAAQSAGCCPSQRHQPPPIKPLRSNAHSHRHHIGELSSQSFKRYNS